MKRITAALVLWIVVLGGLQLYMRRFESPASMAKSAFPSANSPAPPQSQQPPEAGPTVLEPRQGPASPFDYGAGYSMELTATFPVEPDPFALNADGSREPPAVLVRLADREILRLTGNVEPGVPILLSPVPGMDANLNEFYVEANMPLEFSGRNLALQVRVLEDGRPVVEKTFWSEGRNKIAGAFEVSPENDKGGGERHHDER